MSRTGRFNYLLVLLTFAVSAFAIGAAQDHVEPAREPVTAKIKLDKRSMIIVPVSINGSRPYDFMLDTGCAKTIIDQKLADQLGLPRTAEKTVVGVLASTKMSVASVDSMSVAGAVVSGGRSSPQRTPPPSPETCAACWAKTSSGTSICSSIIATRSSS